MNSVFFAALAAGIFLAAGAIIIWWIITSNDFKRKRIKVSEGFSGIEVALTKRFNVLTKLLDVTRKYAAHEKELFEQLVSIRKGMSLEQLKDANAKMDKVTGRIYAVAEGYPELRSAEVFTELQSGIKNVEEHLQAARRAFNSNVTAYNSAIVVFPASIVAKAQHRLPEEFFQAEETGKEDVKMAF